MRFGVVLLGVTLFALSRIDRNSNQTDSWKAESETLQTLSETESSVSAPINQLNNSTDRNSVDPAKLLNSSFLSFSKGMQRMGWWSRNDPIPKKQWPRIDNHTCLPQGSPRIPPNDDPILRSPAIILLGAMKAGTSALASYLRQHPSVMTTKSKELHFYDFEFGRYATENGILRSDAREAYQRLFELGNQHSYEAMREQDKTNMIAVDDSPKYIFLSDRVPARIACVTPWAKLLAILRNPIDRAYSQYNMKDTLVAEKERGGDFEQWLQKDLQDLRETGVIQTHIPRDEFAGSDAEMEAWKTYTRLSTYSPIGRGLYALQIRHWFRIYEDAGIGRDQFFFVRSEEMHTNKEKVYERVLDFVGLDRVQLKDDDDVNKIPYKRLMSDKARKMLEEFYAPYNQELYELLGKEWEGVWDP